MSLQNLLKPNNYELYLGDTNISSLSIDELNPIPPSTNITVNANLITSADDARSLGSAGHGYSGLYARNLYGLNGVVNTVYGINGNSYNSGANNYSVYFPNGLTFTNASTVAGSSNSLNKYNEYTGTMTIGNVGGVVTTPFTAIRIGNILHVSILAFGASPPTAVANGSLQLTPSVTLPHPVNNQLVYVNIITDVTKQMGCMLFGTSGGISLYAGTDVNSDFVATKASAITSGSVNEYVSFSILLN